MLVADEAGLLRLLAERDVGVLVTLHADGRPQLSNVNHVWDPADRTLRVSITDGRAKTRNLRRDPRAAYHVMTPDGWAYTVAEGTAQLGPVAADPHDEAVEDLIQLFRDIKGEHPDWDEYRAAMVADRRLVLRVRVGHVYGRTRR
jgi:PPOX class probable F420-dependent enzyme